MIKAVIAASLVAIGGPAAAQDNDWSVKASTYLWTPKTTTTVETANGPVSSEVSIRDLLSALDFGFMAAVEADYGRWSFIGDLVYSDISSDSPNPLGGLYAEVSGNTQLTIFSGYALYRVTTDPKLSFDVGGGVRVLSNDIGLTLVSTNQPGSNPEASVSASSTWVDPLLALRARYQFNDKWQGMMLVDAGGFNAGSDLTMQLLATVGYRINDKWMLQGGYRYLKSENDDSGRAVKIELSGPIFGVIYQF